MVSSREYPRPNLGEKGPNSETAEPSNGLREGMKHISATSGHRQER
jgi:hypothetical protein